MDSIPSSGKGYRHMSHETMAATFDRFEMQKNIFTIHEKILLARFRIEFNVIPSGRKKQKLGRLKHCVIIMRGYLLILLADKIHNYIFR